MPALPAPPAHDPDGALAWVGDHLGGLWSGPLAASPRFRGGAAAADAALASFDVRGYAGRRSEVWPTSRRGASGLSPWIRHGLLTLPRVWEAVSGGPARDVGRFHDELLWQEYARHLYARLGRGLGRSLRSSPPAEDGADPWPRTMACLDLVVGELEDDGWVVNQTRMWLASQWTVRHHRPWREGEDRMFRHLLDGSRAANRLGWQWTTGAATGKPYGWSRWQVTKRAPGLCDRCDLNDRCPIGGRPAVDDAGGGGGGDHLGADRRLRHDPDPLATGGPERPWAVPGAGDAEAVWLTAEHLGDADPALTAHPDLPAVFVWDRPLLARLGLSAKRLVFLAESLADLASRRPVEIRLGDPVRELEGRRLAATYTPVPGWRDRSARLDVVEVHPWPWLRRPGRGSVRSFSAWRSDLGAAAR